MANEMVEAMRKTFDVEMLSKHLLLAGGVESWKEKMMLNLFYFLQHETQQDKSVNIILLDKYSWYFDHLKQFDLHLEDVDRVVCIMPFLKPWYTPVFNPFDTHYSSNEQLEILATELSHAFIQMLPKKFHNEWQRDWLVPYLMIMLEMKGANFHTLLRLLENDDMELIQYAGQAFDGRWYIFFWKVAGTENEALIEAFKKLLRRLLKEEAFAHMTQGESTFNISKFMQKGAVVLFDLAFNRLGNFSASLFGKLLFSTIVASAKINNQKWKPTFLFVPDFQNKITPNLEQVLETPHGISLLLSNDYNDDLSESMIEKLSEYVHVKMWWKI